MLMGHIAAIGIAASEAIDESASGIVRALEAAPDMLSQALEDGRGQIAAAGDVIRQASLDYAESIREGLRQAAMDTAGAIAEAQAAQHEGFSTLA